MTQKLSLPEELSPENLAELDEDFAIMELVQGQKPDGTKLWAYVNIRLSVYLQFVQKAASNKELSLFDYGEVLMAGYGEEPSEEEKQQAEEQFGADFSFQEKIKEELHKVLAENPDLQKEWEKRNG